MEVREISDKRTWEDVINDIRPNTFLHSWAWGQVQKHDGHDVRYVGLYENEQIEGVCLLVRIRSRRGRFYLVSHGPLLRDASTLQDAIQTISAYCRSKNDGSALRIAPLVETSPETKNVFSSAGFRPAPLHVHAELTWVLDITTDEDTILASMRKTTRHATRKAQREGVTVDISSAPDFLERFWPLYTATTARHQFVPYSKKMLAAQLEEFGKNNQIFTAIATHDGRDVAGAICMHVADTVFYYHGASVKMPASVPAAQLLQWRVIQEAKKRGARRYNFWGIAPESENGKPHPDHPFAGITTFKKGFGGHAIHYLHAQDLPLSWKYWILWGVESWRKYKRGF